MLAAEAMQPRPPFARLTAAPQVSPDALGACCRGCPHYVCLPRCVAVPAEAADDLDAPQDDFGDNQEYKSVDDIEFARGPDDTRGSSVGLGRLSFGGDGALNPPPARSSMLASEATGGTGGLDDGLGMYDEPQGGGDFEYGGGGYEPDEPAQQQPPSAPQVGLFTEESLQDLDMTGVTQRTAKAAAKKRGRCVCAIVVATARHAVCHMLLLRRPVAVIRLQSSPLTAARS